MSELIIITALCVAGLLVLYYILKLLLVVFIIGAQAKVEQMKQEREDYEKSDDQ